MMSAYDFPGLVGGVAGAWLFFLGAVLAILAGLRLAWLARRPGKGTTGRIARGLLAAGGVAQTAGIALYWAAERSALRRELDHLAPWIAVLTVSVAAFAAVWIARRPGPSLAPDGTARDPGAPRDG
jgi:uncharacterized membrane protein YedE/YeeE